MSPWRAAQALAAAALLLTGGCASQPSALKPTVAGLSGWTTSADASRKLEPLPTAAFTSTPTADEETRIDPAQQYQTIVGFGAAITDASAEVLLGMPDQAARDALFDDLFSPEQLNLSFLRLPIGASDFSRRHYSFDDRPSGESDPQLTRFSMTAAQEQLAATRLARQRNSGLLLMASPWSPPGWMKSTDSLIGGRLKPEYRAGLAAYFDRYLTEMEQAGLPVSYLSVQNEPHFEPADYPGMRMDPAERAQFIGQFLGPLLRDRHPGTSILEWDHNWNEPDSPLAVLSDPQARGQIAGVAWHCYGGSPSAQGAVHERWPDKEVFFTECSGGGWATEWADTLGWMTDRLVIESSRNWSRGTLLWNLALDQNSGPHFGGCGNCRGVVTIDSRNGVVTRNVEYYVLGHVSRFVRRGARRVASSEGPAVRNVVFVNPDESRVMVLHNGAAQPKRVKVSDQVRQFSILLPAGEVTTLIWRGPMP